MTVSHDTLTEALRSAGLRDWEANVYITGLQHGPMSVLELSRKTGIPRTTLYGILEKLTERGIMQAVQQKRGITYEASSTDSLKTEFVRKEQVFFDAIAAMEKIRGAVVSKPGAILLEGAHGVTNLWKRIFASGVKDYAMITSGFTFLHFMQEEYLLKKVISERVERGIFSRQLIPDSPHARKIIERDKEDLRESRFLPKHVNVPVTILMYGKEVACITTRRENAAIVISSDETALTFRTLFELLWSYARVL